MNGGQRVTFTAERRYSTRARTKILPVPTLPGTPSVRAVGGEFWAGGSHAPCISSVSYFFRSMSTGRHYTFRPCPLPTTRCTLGVSYSTPFPIFGVAASTKCISRSFFREVTGPEERCCPPTTDVFDENHEHACSTGMGPDAVGAVGDTFCDWGKGIGWEWTFHNVAMAFHSVIWAVRNILRAFHSVSWIHGIPCTFNHVRPRL